jgi:hypothetical protein
MFGYNGETTEHHYLPASFICSMAITAHTQAPIAARSTDGTTNCMLQPSGFTCAAREKSNAALCHTRPLNRIKRAIPEEHAKCAIMLQLLRMWVCT